MTSDVTLLHGRLVLLCKELVDRHLSETALDPNGSVCGAISRRVERRGGETAPAPTPLHEASDAHHLQIGADALGPSVQMGRPLGFIRMTRRDGRSVSIANSSTRRINEPSPRSALTKSSSGSHGWNGNEAGFDP